MNATDRYPLFSNETVFSSYPPILLDFAASCCIFFAIIGVTGNLISVIALASCHKLRNATTAFIINLCIADFIFCAFSLPLSAVTFLEREWNYGEVLCKLFPLFRYSNAAVSLFSMIAITFNRYVLVVHRHLYPKMYTRRNIALKITFIWIISFVLFFLPLFEIWGRFGYDPKVGTCSILPLNNKSPKISLYAIAFGFPSVIFIACYTRIYCVVRRSSKKLRNTLTPSRDPSKDFRFSKRDFQENTRHNQGKRKELRVLRVMLVVFVTFVLCYFPVSFVKILKKEDSWPFLNIAGYLAVYLSSCINPIIYVAMSKEYRRAYRGLFWSLFAKIRGKRHLEDISADSFRYVDKQPR